MALEFSRKPLVVGVVTDASVWRGLSPQDTPCDVVEFRADAMLREPLAELLGQKPSRAVLLTLRHSSEGGGWSGSEAERMHLAEQLLAAVDALDWEIAALSGAEALLTQAKAAGKSVIASAHYFDRTPSLDEMLELEARAVAAHADVVKVAFTPQSVEDLKVGEAFLRRSRIPAAVMGMGALGVESRKLYSRMGSALLYGYLGSEPAVPGQLSAAQCTELCR